MVWVCTHEAGAKKKKMRVCVTYVLPQYKLIGCQGIKSMTFIRIDDMYNVSPLIRIGIQDISSLGQYKETPPGPH